MCENISGSCFLNANSYVAVTRVKDHVVIPVPIKYDCHNK